MYKNNILNDIVDLFFILLIVLFIRSIIFESSKIPSSSMTPTLLIGDFVFCNKFVYKIHIPFLNKTFLNNYPRSGDVLIFSKNGKKYVKRVIGFSGDIIKYSCKKLFLNNILLKKKKIYCVYKKKKNKCVYLEYFGPKTEFFIKIKILFDETYCKNYYNLIDKWRFFLLGDNRDNSLDSRFFGLIDYSNIVGKAFVIWFSLDIYKIDIRFYRFFKKVL